MRTFVTFYGTDIDGKPQSETCEYIPGKGATTTKQFRTVNLRRTKTEVVNDRGNIAATPARVVPTREM